MAKAFRFSSIFGSLFPFLFLSLTPCKGQKNDADAKVKAAFIYSFTKYIRWENQDKLPVFSIGVLGNENTIVDELDKIADIKKVGLPPYQKTLIIKPFKNIESISSVQMLYVNKRSGFEIEKILMKLKGTGILLVSENYPYQSSMINFMLVGNFQKFEYNRKKIEAEKMTISSEIDEFAVTSDKDWREFARQKVGELKDEKEKVETQKEMLSFKEVEIKKKNLEVEQKNREIEQQVKIIEKQKEERNKLFAESEKLLKSLQDNKDKFESQKIEMMKQNVEIEKQENTLKRKKGEAKKLAQEAQKLEQLIEEQKNSLSEKESKIENQRITLYFAAVVVLLIAGFGAFIFRQYKAKQRINKMLEEKNIAIQEQKEQIEQQKKLVDIKNKNITASINYAKRIQQAILISREHLNEIMPQHFIFYRPRDIVSGDFYWAHESKSGKLIFAAVDCTGHGVPGAFMSMVGNALLNEIIIENKVEEVDEILNQMKKGVIQALKQTGAAGEQKDGMDISLVSLQPKFQSFGKGVFSNSKNAINTPLILNFSGANNPLYHFRKGVFTEYKGERQTIGYEKGKENPFVKHSIEVIPGDTIYIFTDGFADQKGGPEGRKFYYKTLINLFSSIQNLSMQEQRAAVKKTFDEWKGNHEQIDDICVMGVKI